MTDHKTATDLLAKGGEALQDFSSTTLPTIAGHSFALNIPAFLIVAAVTVLLVYGIRESARTNTMIVIIKVAVVVFFIAFGAFMVNPTNWHPFLPHGFRRGHERRGHCLLRLHWVRCRLDHGGRNARTRSATCRSE